MESKYETLIFVVITFLISIALLLASSALVGFLAEQLVTTEIIIATPPVEEEMHFDEAH